MPPAPTVLVRCGTDTSSRSRVRTEPNGVIFPGEGPARAAPPTAGMLLDPLPRGVPTGPGGVRHGLGRRSYCASGDRPMPVSVHQRSTAPVSWPLLPTHPQERSSSQLPAMNPPRPAPVTIIAVHCIPLQSCPTPERTSPQRLDNPSMSSSSVLILGPSNPGTPAPTTPVPPLLSLGEQVLPDYRLTGQQLPEVDVTAMERPAAVPASASATCFTAGVTSDRRSALHPGAGLGPPPGRRRRDAVGHRRSAGQCR